MKRIRPSRTRVAALLLASALALSACGLRASDEQARAALQANLPTQLVTVGAGGGTGTAAPDGSGGQTLAPGGGVSSGQPGATLGAGGPGAGSTSSQGNNSGGGGGSTGGGSGQQHCSSTLSTINIGTVGEQSGIFAPFLVPGVQAMQAWVAQTNATGGINCHPIKYYIKDDGGDPSTAQSEVQQLVEQNHIVAMVYMDAPIAGNASVTYLSAHGIPVIGSEGGSDWFYTKPNYFPQITTGVSALGSLITAIAKVGAKSGKHTIGVLSCLEAALCSSLYKVAPDLATKNHLNLAYNGQASLTQPNFTSTCQSAQSKHVDLFVAGMDTNSIERLLANCASIGFHPLYITGGPLVAPPLIADSQSEGFYVASYSDLYTDTSNGQIAAMRAALSRYAPGVPPSIDAAAGWASAQLFQYAVEHASSLNPAGIMAALYKVKNNDLNGLTAPLTFTKGQNPPRVSCYWIGQVHNKSVIHPAGLPAGRICG